MPSPFPLEAAFDRYYPAIFRYFRYRGADANTANDLAAATFERALENLSSYDPAIAQAQTWLFTLARNLGSNYWKAESARPSIPLEDDLPQVGDPSLEQTLINTQDKAAILRALQTLDERTREIVALKFGGPFTNRQIAELTELGESNVGVILYRALLKLRAQLIASQEARDE